MGLPSRLPPLPTIRDVIRVYKLTAMRQLAQNFMLDMNICRKFANCLGDLQGAHVCEVGPGPGGITRALLESPIQQLTVVEKDRRFLPGLELLAEASPVPMNIIHGDILRTDLSEVAPKDPLVDWTSMAPNFKLIGNLPFNISTPLIIRWLQSMSERSGPFCNGRTPLILSFQKEVAERMVAPLLSPHRCRLSIICQYLADVKIKFIIPGKVFVPAPDVDAAVVEFIPRVNPLIRLSFKLVEKFCRHTFHFRRKYCVRGVESLFPPEMAKELADEIFRRTRVSPKVQCTQLSISEISDMCHVYEEICRRQPGLFLYDYRKPVDMLILSSMDKSTPDVYGHTEIQLPMEETLGRRKPFVSVRHLT